MPSTSSPTAWLLAAAGTVLEIWRGEFHWMHEHVEGGIITYCMHPHVIDRRHRMAMLEQLVRHCLEDGDA